MQIYNELVEQYGGPQNSQQQDELEALYAMLGDLQQQISRPVQSYSGGWGDETYKALLQKAIDMNYDDWAQSDQYKALADRYGHQGKLTMQDVLGQIASRTGGLASSYATTAANQQYNDYMAQLEDAARMMFAGERGDLIENAQLAQEYGQQEYARYLDQLNQKNQQSSYALDIINQMMGYQTDKQNTQYNKEQTARSEAQNRIYDYLVNQGGSVGELDAKLITTSGYTTSELNAMEAKYKQNQAAAAAKAKGTGGGTTSGPQESDRYSDVRKNAMGYDDLEDAEAYLNRMVDGGYITEDEAYKNEALASS